MLNKQTIVSVILIGGQFAPGPRTIYARTEIGTGDSGLSVGREPW